MDYDRTPTILSGLLPNYDATHNRSERLLTAINATNILLDGFIINGATRYTAGRRFGTENPFGSSGAALSALKSSLALQHCTFSENGSDEGSTQGDAVFGIESPMTFTDCVFLKNLSGTSPVGGVGCTFTRCSFIQNHGKYDSGALVASNTMLVDCVFGRNVSVGGYVSAGAIHVVGKLDCSGCTFTNNGGLGNGGAIFAEGAAIFLSNCSFSDNFPDVYSQIHFNGGAIAVDGGSLAISSCSFANNTALAGGAIQITNGAAVTITNSSFAGNVGTSGGAIECESSTVAITGSVFSSNHVDSYRNYASGISTEYYGAAIAASDTELKVSNCTFAGNWIGCYRSPNRPVNPVRTIEGSGGAISATGVMAISNSIFFRNLAKVASAIYAPKDSITLSRSSILEADPRFMRNPSAGPDRRWTSDDDDFGDLHLQPNSPAINKGSNAALPSTLTTDLDGHPRIQSTTVDLGAYEASPDLTLAPLSLKLTKSKTPATPSNLSLTLKLSNLGVSLPSASLSFTFYLSTTSTLPSSATPFATLTRTYKLAYHAASTLNFVLPLPTNTPAGSLYLFALATASLTEQSLSNNSAAFAPFSLIAIP